MQDRVFICIVLMDIRNGYLRVDRHRVIRRREPKQEDHSFFLLKKGNELRSLSAELGTKPKRETSVVFNQTESLQPPSRPPHFFYCKIYQLATRGRSCGLCWLISLLAAKQSVLYKRQQKPVCQRSNCIA